MLLEFIFPTFNGELLGELRLNIGDQTCQPLLFDIGEVTSSASATAETVANRLLEIS